MSILTPKMKSARSDHYGDNCKLWMPCDDIGNSIVDRINGISISDAGIAGHDEPHAISILSTAQMSIPAMSDIVIPRQGLFVSVLKVATSFALTGPTIGRVDASNRGLQLNGAAATLKTANGTAGPAMSAGAVAADAVCWAIAYDMDNAYSYEGIGADAALVNTVALSTALKSDLTAGVSLSSFATINSVTQSPIYGMALFDFSNDGLPDDLLVGINWMRGQWLSGKKTLYEDWKQRT